jgi:hypothetical protein
MSQWLMFAFIKLLGNKAKQTYEMQKILLKYKGGGGGGHQKKGLISFVFNI